MSITRVLSLTDVIRLIPVAASWFLLHAYAGRPLLTAAHFLGIGPAGAWAMLMIVATLPLLPLVPRREGLPNNVLQWIGYSVMALSSMLVVFVMAGDILRLFIWLLEATASAIPAWSHVATTIADLGWWRLFATMNVAILAGAVVFFFVGVAQARCPATRHVTIPVTTPDLDGFRIVQISDVHIGATIRRGFLGMVVDRVNELKPGMVAITGDLVDGPSEQLGGELRVLRNLESRYGTYYVTGNHEYYWDAASWIEVIEEQGVIVLQNENRIIDVGSSKLMVAGVNDFAAKHIDPTKASDVSAALEGSADVRILLAHQPQHAERVAGAGCDLQLSGHTHGGQFFPFNLLIRFFQPIVAGLHRVGVMWLYVNRGTGYWGPPTRFGVGGEITLLTLRYR